MNILKIKKKAKANSRFDKMIKRRKAWKDFKDTLLLIFLLNLLVNSLQKIDLSILAYEATPATVIYIKDNATPPEEPVNVPDQLQDSLVAEFSAYTINDGFTPSDITASGKKVEEGMLACPSKYKLGTKIEIEGMGTYVCEDRMAERFRNGEYFDVYVSDYASAIQFGRKNLSYRVI